MMDSAAAPVATIEDGAGGRPRPSAAGQPRAGSMLVLCLFLIALIVIIAGFAINLAHLQLTRTELQTATDASVRAASRIYNLTGSMSQAVAKAQEVANGNPVGGERLVLQASDFTLGRTSRNSQQRYSFAAGGNGTNALQLNSAKAAGSPSGPVRLPFPNLLGSQFSNLHAVAIATQAELDIMLVIDRSGSMAYAASEPAIYPPVPAAAPPGWNFGMPVPVPSRWVDTEQAIFVFLQEIMNSPLSERIGLATYATTASLDVDLTTNYQSILNALQVYSNAYPLGATNIGDGIAVAVNAFASSPQARPWASRVIVVMTDGIHNTGSDPLYQAGVAADGGIMVFAVTFALEADQSRMRNVAARGGGKHFHASSAADLRNVFQEIARLMPSLISQ